MIASCTVSPGCVLQDGRTALHWAALSGHNEKALDLIKMMADVDAVDGVGVNTQIRSYVVFHVYSGEHLYCQAKQSGLSSCALIVI